VEFLVIRDLRKSFRVGGGLFGEGKSVKAVDGVSLTVRRDSVFAIVGESGCGKSTLGRLIVRLTEPSGGDILFKGRHILEARGKELKDFRKRVQIIFQDPYASLNPRMKIGSSVAEPLKVHKVVPRRLLRDKVAELLAAVGLSADAMDKYPHEFSGGQRQRVCIARALSLSPELIVADEPLSALDVSIQAQILTLLQDLKKKHEISFIFISHDLHIVHYFSDEVAVMYLGKIVERAPTEVLFSGPLHPYSELLLGSVPKLRREGGSPVGEAAAGGADVPSPVEIPSGCAFHPRCLKRFDECDKVEPELLSRGERHVRCLLYR